MKADERRKDPRTVEQSNRHKAMIFAVERNVMWSAGRGELNHNRQDLGGIFVDDNRGLLDLAALRIFVQYCGF